jgi:hypothetical protein
VALSKFGDEILGMSDWNLMNQCAVGFSGKYSFIGFDFH